jgi:transcriptional regulator with XRE-family HTH domain
MLRAMAKRTLGERLKELRTGKGLSLRDVEKKFGINSGYLSQLESDKISNPTPSMLKKLSVAYQVPLGMLMEWAGYIERDEGGTSPHVETALKYLPNDVSEEELKALKAVLGAMRGGAGRGGKATAYRPHYSDLELDPGRRLEIRKNALAVLREIDAVHGRGPVDLDNALVVAKLVRAGAIELDPDERERLRDRFRGLVDHVLTNLEGVVHLGRNEVYINADLHALRERFVLAHEIGHGVLEDHREVFAHLDNHHRLSPDFNDRLEREANQFSIELLAKGDRLRQEFDSSKPEVQEISRLSQQMDLSHQATARRVGEESRQDCAIALAFRGRNGQGPLQVDRFRFWASSSFEKRFGWRSGQLPGAAIRAALSATARNEETPSITLFDGHGRPVEVRVEGLDALYSVFVLFAPVRRRPLFNSKRPRSPKLLSRV